MKVGFNYPWSFNDYGVQIGPYPHGKSDAEWAAESKLINSKHISSIKLPRLFDRIDQNLQELKSLKIEIVRWFLLCNGYNYGKPPTWRYADVSAQDIIWDFDPPAPLDPRFAFYFRELLLRFRKAGMQIIPCFLDFPMMGGSIPPGGKNFAPGGRADCIRSGSKRSTFLTWTFTELLFVAKDFKDVIFAWDIINEPIFTIVPPVSPILPLWREALENQKKYNLKLPHWPICTPTDLTQFLIEAINLLDIFNIKHTIGHRRFFDLTYLPTGNTPQYHYYAQPDGYADPGSIPPFTGNPPPILGEFASHLDQNYNHPWPDLKGKTDNTFERLKLLESLGCQVCLIWADVPSSGEQDSIKLQEETKKQIKKFTGAK